MRTRLWVLCSVVLIGGCGPDLPPPLTGALDADGASGSDAGTTPDAGSAVDAESVDGFDVVETAEGVDTPNEEDVTRPGRGVDTPDVGHGSEPDGADALSRVPDGGADAVEVDAPEIAGRPDLDLAESEVGNPDVTASEVDTGPECADNPCGGCTVLAAVPGSACSADGWPGTVVCASPESTSCQALVEETVQPPAAWVIGRVISWTTGLPVAGVTVGLNGAESGPSTDSAGRFAVGANRSGGALLLTHAEYVSRALPVPPARETVDLGDVPLLLKDPAVTWIGPAGGLATSSDGTVQLAVPEGALATETPVRITPIPAPEVMPAPLPVGRSNFTHCADIEPHGTVLAGGANLRFEDWRGFHNDFEPTVVVSPTQVVAPNTWVPLGYADAATAQWVHVGWGASVTDGEGTTPWLQAEISHFSPFDLNLVGGFGAGNGPGGVPFPPGDSDAPGSGGEGDRAGGPEELAASDLDCEDEAVGGAVNRRTGALHVWHRLPPVDAGWGPYHLTLDYFDQRAVPRLERTYRVVVPEVAGFLLPSDGAVFSVGLGSGQPFAVNYDLTPGLNRATVRRLLGPEVATGFHTSLFTVSYQYSGVDFCQQLGFGGLLSGECASVASDEPATFLHQFNDRLLVRQETDNPFGAGWSLRGDMELFVDPETARYVLVSGRRVEPLSAGAPVAQTLRSLATPFQVGEIEYQEVGSVTASASDIVYLTAKRASSGLWEVLKLTPSGATWTAEHIAGAPGPYWDASDQSEPVPTDAEAVILADPRDLEVTAAGDALYLADNHLKRVLRLPLQDGGEVEVIAGSGSGQGWVPGVAAVDVGFSELAGLAIEESADGPIVWQLGRLSLDADIPDVQSDFGRVLRIGPDGLLDVVYARPRHYDEDCDCISTLNAQDVYRTDLLSGLTGGEDAADIAVMGDGTLAISAHNTLGATVTRLYPFDILVPVLGRWSSAAVIPPPTALALQTGVYLPKAVALDDAGRVIVPSGLTGKAHVMAFRPNGTAGLALGPTGLPQRIVDLATLSGGRYLLTGAGQAAGVYEVSPVPVPPPAVAAGALALATTAPTPVSSLDATKDGLVVDWQPALPAMPDHHAAGLHQLTLATGDVVVFEDGRLIERQLRTGGTLIYERDGQGRLVWFGYDSGLGWSLDYDTDQTTITDVAGRTTVLEVAPPTEAAEATAHPPVTRRPSLASITDADGTVTMLGYDQAGFLVSKSTVGIAVETFERDGAGRVIAVFADEVLQRQFELADQAGAVVADQQGQVQATWAGDLAVPAGTVRTSGVTDAMGSLTEFDFNAWDRESAVRDALGNEWVASFSNVDDPHPAAVVAPDGDIRTYQYDSVWRLVETAYCANGLGLPPASALTIERTDFGLIKKLATLHGTTMEAGFDEAGRLVSLWPGPKTSLDPVLFQYDPEGRLTGMTSPAGSVSLTREDGTLSGVLDGADTLWPISTDLAGAVASLATPSGVTVEITRDAMGRVTARSDGAGGVWQSLGYQPYNDCPGCRALGLSLGMIDPLGHEWSLTRDGQGRIVAATLPDGTARSWERDAAGRVSAVTFPDGDTASFERDVLGRVVGVEQADGELTTIAYDEHLRDGVAEVVLPSGELVAYERNALGLVDRIIEADGTSTLYTRDSRGRVTLLQDDAGASWSLDYGPGGQLDASTGPTGTALFEWIGGWQQLAGISWSDGESISLSYDDPRGLLTAMSHGEQATTFVYDQEGRLATTIDAETTTSCTYSYTDPRGWLTGRNCTPGWSETIERDGRGLLQDYNDELVSYSLTHDVNGAIEQVSTTWPGAGSQVAVARDLNGQIMALGSGAVWTMERDQRGRPTLIQLAGGTVTRHIVRDTAGRLAGELRAGPTGFQAWGYVWSPGSDLEQRLAASCQALAMDPAEWADESPLAAGSEPSPPCGSWDLVTDYQYTNGHRLLGATDAGGFTDERDLGGRLLRRTWSDGRTLDIEWTARGYAALLTMDEDVSVQDFRSASGSLIARVGAGVVMRFTSQGPMTSIYVSSSELSPEPGALVPVSALPSLADMELEIVYWNLPLLGRALWHLPATNDWLWAHTDHNGVAWWVEDLDTNETVLELGPDPFGRLDLQAQGPLGAKLATLPLPLFPGQWWDPRSGLVHNGHRLYDPETGSYLRPDPTGQEGGLNVFTYALGDPVAVTDPTGLLWCKGCQAAAQAHQNPQFDAVLLGASMLPGIGEIIDLFDCMGGDAIACGALGLPVASGRALRAAAELTGQVIGSCIITNKRLGKAWEDEVGAALEADYPDVEPEITIKTHGPKQKKVRPDFVALDDGVPKCHECKASDTAPFTKNQKEGYPELEEYGGVVVGKGKPKVPGGTEIPPGPVTVHRPAPGWTPDLD